MLPRTAGAARICPGSERILMNSGIAPPVGRPMVLIVDDTPANVAMLAEHLGNHGLSVLVAQDGEEGIERARFVLPDLILPDVMMAGMGGFEVCRRLKDVRGDQGHPGDFHDGAVRDRRQDHRL